MSSQECTPAGANGEGAGVSLGDADHYQSNRPGAVPCPPRCARVCVLDRHLSLVLSDHLEAPPCERLAWAIVGLGPTVPPLPADRFRDVLAAVADRYGPGVVADGLAKVARRPLPHGVDIDRARLEALAGRWRSAAGVAA